MMMMFTKTKPNPGAHSASWRLLAALQQMTSCYYRHKFVFSRYRWV